MKITPAIKGQLTKAINLGNADMKSEVTINNCIDFTFGDKKTPTQRVIDVFNRHMPREQAKHTARKYLASLAVLLVMIAVMTGCATATQSLPAVQQQPIVQPPATQPTTNDLPTPLPRISLVDSAVISTRLSQTCSLAPNVADILLESPHATLVDVVGAANHPKRIILLVGREAAVGDPETQVEALYAQMVMDARTQGVDVVLGAPLGYVPSDPLVRYLAQLGGNHFWDTTGIVPGVETDATPAQCAALTASYTLFNGGV